MHSAPGPVPCPPPCCRSIVRNFAVIVLHLQQLSIFAKEPFSQGTDEMQAVKKVLAGSRSMDLPQMLRPMPPDERAAWLALHGVPHIVQVHTLYCVLSHDLEHALAQEARARHSMMSPQPRCQFLQSARSDSSCTACCTLCRHP